MNELDQFMKHELRVKKYARYTDDFVIVSDNRACLESLVPQISEFLHTQLALSLHPNKVSIRKYRQGVDFLGYGILPNHIKVRTKTRRRIFRKLRSKAAEFKEGKVSEESFRASICSYLGVLSHADAHELGEELQNLFWPQQFF